MKNVFRPRFELVGPDYAVAHRDEYNAPLPRNRPAQATTPDFYVAIEGMVQANLINVTLNDRNEPDEIWL